MAARGCSGCECSLFDEDKNGLVPFRYETYAAAPFGNGFCLPTVSKDDTSAVATVVDALVESFKNSDAGSMTTQWMRDILNAWTVIALCSFTALIFGYVYLWTISLIGGVIIYASIGMIVLTLMFAGSYTMYYRDIAYNPDEDSQYNYLTWAGYACFAFVALIFFLLCCCWNAIKIGIAVFKTTAQYVRSNLRIFILPFASYVIIGIWSVFWIGGAAFIFSVGTPTPRDDGYPFLSEVKWSRFTRGAFLFDVFGLFWINAFIIGVAQFIIGCSACLWYFEH